MTHQARNRRLIYADYVRLLAPEELHRAVSQEPTQPGLAIEQTHSERAEDSATIP